MANKFYNQTTPQIGTTTVTQVYSGSRLDNTDDVGIVIGMLFTNTGSTDTKVSAYLTQAEQAVTASSDSGLKFTAGSVHGFSANDMVIFTGTLPGNISANTIYHVISGNLTTTVFYVATASGGSAVAHSSNGSSVKVHRIIPYLNDVTLPTGTALEFCRGNKIVVQEGESINAVRTGGNSASSLLNILEITS